MAAEVLGIDPGFRSGGMAFFDADDRIPVCVSFAKLTLAEIVELIGTRAPTFAAIENVGSLPRQKGAREFDQHVGALYGVLTALRVPFEPVVPSTWQKSILGASRASGAVSKAQRHADLKKLARTRAQQLYPLVLDLDLSEPSLRSPKHSNADALLIGEFARRFL